MHFCVCVSDCICVYVLCVCVAGGVLWSVSLCVCCIDASRLCLCVWGTCVVLHRYMQVSVVGWCCLSACVSLCIFVLCCVVSVSTLCGCLWFVCVVTVGLWCACVTLHVKMLQHFMSLCVSALLGAPESHIPHPNESLGTNPSSSEFLLPHSAGGLQEGMTRPVGLPGRS